jgi:hypothetical protein
MLVASMFAISFVQHGAAQGNQSSSSNMTGAGNQTSVVVQQLAVVT